MRALRCRHKRRKTDVVPRQKAVVIFYEQNRCDFYVQYQNVIYDKNNADGELRPPTTAIKNILRRNARPERA